MVRKKQEVPKLCTDFLEKALKKCQFVPSHEDAMIYYGCDMAIAVYVDDVLFFGPSEADMETIIDEIQSDGFELKQEKGGDDTAYNFLGISITEDSGTIKMTQFGLIKKFLKTVGMEDCNSKTTLCSTTPPSTNNNGPYHNEDWEYALDVGMLMYLAGNAHPEIVYAVHQCTHFTHSPCQSHAIAIKCIAKYLRGVLQHKQGLLFTPTDKLNLDCYVDADFAGLYGYEDDQDPVSVHSCTGSVMTMGECPIK
jgi:Reverse transcriptase (RNA-dependent DNA polymerase)